MRSTSIIFLHQQWNCEIQEMLECILMHRHGISGIFLRITQDIIIILATDMIRDIIHPSRKRIFHQNDNNDPYLVTEIQKDYAYMLDVTTMFRIKLIVLCILFL